MQTYCNSLGDMDWGLKMCGDVDSSCNKKEAKDIEKIVESKPQLQAHTWRLYKNCADPR